MQPAPETVRKVVTATELAAMLGIATETLDKWIRKGKIPPPVKPGGNTRVWTAEEVERLLTPQRVKMEMVTLLGCPIEPTRLRGT